MSYVFGLSVVSENTIIPVDDVPISHKLKPGDLTVRADNGSQ